MTKAGPSSEIICTLCGHAGTGKYCSNCGSEFAISRSPPFVQLAGKVFPAQQLTTYSKTYFHVMLSPVGYILGLVNSPSYSGHYAFLAISISIHAVIVGLGSDQGNGPLANLILSFIRPLFFFIAVLVWTNVKYGLLRLSGLKGEVYHEYAKLSMLCWGFIAPIYAPIVAIRNTVESGEPSAIHTLEWVSGIVLVVYISYLEHRLVGVSFIVMMAYSIIAILVTVATFLLIVSPLLFLR